MGNKHGYKKTIAQVHLHSTRFIGDLCFGFWVAYPEVGFLSRRLAFYLLLFHPWHPRDGGFI